MSNIDDCDDTDNRIYTGAAEVCDGVDNDCDGNTDDGFVTTDYYPDADGDGYGNAGATPVASCTDLLQALDCYDVVMFDSYGDGWNGGSLRITINGVLADSGLTGGIDNQDSGEFWASGYGTTIEDAFCVTSP